MQFVAPALRLNNVERKVAVREISRELTHEADHFLRCTTHARAPDGRLEMMGEVTAACELPGPAIMVLELNGSVFESSF